MWVKERLNNLVQGNLFRRNGFYFVFNGDAGRRARGVFASLLVPVADQPYCQDNGDLEHEHWLIDEVEFHAALYYPGEEDEEDDDEIWEPGLFVRKRSSEINMWVELYQPTQ